MRAPLTTNPSIHGRNNPWPDFTYLTAKLRITKPPLLRAPSPENRRANTHKKKTKKKKFHTYKKQIKVKKKKKLKNNKK
jgi:hypothetical protein